jgi:hypothetical protein
MVRRVFFSFHFDNDYWRTQQVRNMGTIEGQSLCTPNQWEKVKRKGEAAVEKWIGDNISGKSCVVVLVGAETSNRHWVIEEIAKGWNAGKGVVGIKIHKLLDSNSLSSIPGSNPFDKVTLRRTGDSLSSVAKLVMPFGADSKAVYASIKDGMENWIEEAIEIRSSR